MAVDWERCYSELSGSFDSLQREVGSLFTSVGIDCAACLERRPPRIVVSYPAIDDGDKRISRIAIGISGIAKAYGLQVSGCNAHGDVYYFLKPDYKKFEAARRRI